MSKDNKVKLRCQACGDAENCNFYCELIIAKMFVNYDELCCPISGDVCEWDEVENLEAKRIAELEAENEHLKKWQIKPSEAICLTDLSCRYKKVFKND